MSWPFSGACDSLGTEQRFDVREFARIQSRRSFFRTSTSFRNYGHVSVQSGGRLLAWGGRRAVSAFYPAEDSDLVAHLAGAPGKPVWTLLPFAADGRRLIDRPDTPWYPTMRLFRQTRRRAGNPWWRKSAGS